MLALFMNLQNQLFYELLSNYMGKGDKETFAFAALAVNATFHLCALVPEHSI